MSVKLGSTASCPEKVRPNSLRCVFLFMRVPYTNKEVIMLPSFFYQNTLQGFSVEGFWNSSGPSSSVFPSNTQKEGAVGMGACGSAGGAGSAGVAGGVGIGV